MFSAVLIVAFEELEKALSTAQKTEEARRQMKAEMDEQIKAIEKTSEEERISLQQELSRVKQEVVDIMKVRIILDRSGCVILELQSDAFLQSYCKEELICFQSESFVVFKV